MSIWCYNCAKSGPWTCRKKWMWSRQTKNGNQQLLQITIFYEISKITIKKQYRHYTECDFNTILCLCAHSCLTFCDFMDCSPPGSFVHWILQARILGWVVMPSSRGSSRPRGHTRVSCISCTESRFFTHWATWEAPYIYIDIHFILINTDTQNSYKWTLIY